MTERRVISISTGTIVKVIAVLLTLGFLYLIRDVLALVIVSWLLATAFSPTVNWLNRVTRIPRPLGLAAMYVLIGGVIALLVVLFSPIIADQVKQLGASLPHYIDDINKWWISLTGTAAPLPNISQLPAVKGLAGNLMATVFGVFSTVLATLLVIVLSFYFTAEESSIRKLVGALVPPSAAVDVTKLITRIQSRLGLWLRGQLVLSLVVGVLVYIGLTIIGVKYALLLALLATVLEIVPFVGPTISGAVAALLVIASGAPMAVVLLVIGLYVLVQQLENNILSPKILGSSVEINPLIVIIAVLVGATVAGILGALVAVPISALLAEVAKEVWARRQSSSG
jgi:predicted PurR-regulated permease PerM